MVRRPGTLGCGVGCVICRCWLCGSSKTWSSVYTAPTGTSACSRREITSAIVSVDRRASIAALNAARKAQSKERTLVLGTILANLKNREIELRRPASDEEVAEELAQHAKALGKEPDELRTQLESGGRMGALGADIIRRKALDLIVRVPIRILLPGQ